MIKVNLLAGPAAAPVREWFPREQRAALAGLALLVVTALGVGGTWYYLRGVRADIATRTTEAEAEMVRLKEAAALVDQATARKTELSERLGVIERLRAAKREPVDLLETLSRSLSEGLWLLEIRQSGTSVQVDGRALSISAVTDFAEHLQNSGMFKRPVEILATSMETYEETTVVRFSVRGDLQPTTVDPAALTPPDASATAGVVVAPAGAGA